MKTLKLVLILSFPLVLHSAARASGVCPAYGAAPGCNEVITVNADGSFTVAGMPANGTNYDGSDDALVGIINNTSNPLSSITLDGNGVDIFGFDGDGLAYYGAPGNAFDTTGYGGPNTYFTGISPDYTKGTANFITALAANGGNTYFSLEESFNPATPVTPGPGPSSVTPEPGSLLLLGTGMLGIVGLLRRDCLSRSV